MNSTIIRTACKTALVATDIGVGPVTTRLGNGQIMVSPLTRCCEGAATGTTTTSTGVACKGCWREVPEVYGAAATTQAQVASLLGSLGCPVPEECATEVAFKIEREVSV